MKVLETIKSPTLHIAVIEKNDEKKRWTKKKDDKKKLKKKNETKIQWKKKKFLTASCHYADFDKSNSFQSPARKSCWTNQQIIEY